MEGGKIRASYEEDLNRLKTAQKNAAIAGLENTRNQALSNLEAEKQANATLYNQQRSTANAQNRMNAKNFQEYLASTGRANSGLPSQARMQYNNNLQNSLTYLNSGEAGALADINRRSTLANDNYNSGLASANATIEANYIQNLMNERNKELERQLQERQLQESIRQFNENLALQREKMYSNFSSGSGGGSTGSSSAKTNTTTKTTTKTSSKVGTKASSTVSKKLDKLEKTNNFDIGEIKTKQGGLANVKVFDVNGTLYYKVGNDWVVYR